MCSPHEEVWEKRDSVLGYVIIITTSVYHCTVFHCVFTCVLSKYTPHIIDLLKLFLRTLIPP